MSDNVIYATKVMSLLVVFCLTMALMVWLRVIT